MRCYELSVMLGLCCQWLVDNGHMEKSSDLDLSDTQAFATWWDRE